jgi:hypothetical protein
MVYRDFACNTCNSQIEILYNSVNDIVPNTIELKCSVCFKKRTFEKVFTAPYHTFGMLTKQYTGQAAAVKGHGSHQLDYDVGDLAKKRAIDATMEFNEKANLSHINKSLEKSIENQKAANT